MSTPDFLNPYSRLMKIRLLGRETEVPENNTLLRCFQYLCPETIPYGRFCWNNECGSSGFDYQLPGDPETLKARACLFQPVEGLDITDVSGELRYALRTFLEANPLEELSPEDGEDDPMPDIKFR